MESEVNRRNQREKELKIADGGNFKEDWDLYKISSCFFSFSFCHFSSKRTGILFFIIIIIIIIIKCL